MYFGYCAVAVCAAIIMPSTPTTLWVSKPLFTRPSIFTVLPPALTDETSDFQSTRCTKDEWKLTRRVSHNIDFDEGRRAGRAVNLLSRLHKLIGSRVRYVREGLWISVRQRKPRALHLYQNLVPLQKTVIYVRHHEVNLLYFSRLKRLRLLEAVPEFPAERLASHQLL